jgi:SAM-dependent methyltransferase
MTVVASRPAPDARRDVVWRSLWRYRFSAMVRPEDCVLDLGAGYGSFINHVEARRRIAVDTWDGFPAHLAPGVEYRVGSATDLDFLEDGAVDFAFASNLFEHLSQDAFSMVLAALYQKLSADGTLTIVQPNYRHAFREYFDDFDHRSVWSHVGLADQPVADPCVARLALQADWQADACPRQTPAFRPVTAGP